MNISSLVVHVRSEEAAGVRAELARWPGVEVPAAAPDGRLVVTVETATDRESSECFGRIGALPGVMSVSLVYHQLESEPDATAGLDAGSTGSAASAASAESPESTDAPEEARHDC